MKTNNGWYDVRYLLPEVTKKNPRHRVLTVYNYLNTKERDIVVQDYEMKNGRCYFWTDEEIKGRISHWREVPELPEVEDE